MMVAILFHVALDHLFDFYGIDLATFGVTNLQLMKNKQLFRVGQGLTEK